MTRFRIASTALFLHLVGLLASSPVIFAQELFWVKGAGGANSDFGNGIAVDGAGNSYVTGGFSGTATFGAGEANQITRSSAGANDVFVAKYNSEGFLEWMRGAGGTNSEFGLGVAVDNMGNSYVREVLAARRCSVLVK